MLAERTGHGGIRIRKEANSPHRPCLLGSQEGDPDRGPTDLVKGDFFRVPVLDVEEHDHSAILVPSGEDARVASLDGAADGLQG